MLPDALVFIGCALSSFQTRNAKSVLWGPGITVYCADGVAFTEELIWNGADQSAAFQKFFNHSAGYPLDIPLLLYDVYVERLHLLDVFWAAQQCHQSPCDVYLSVLREDTLGGFAECAS